MQKTVEEIAKELFDHYPNVKQFHFTADAQAFENKEQAGSHAATLEDSDIVTVERPKEAPTDKKADPKKEKALEAAKQKLAGATADFDKAKLAYDTAVPAEKEAAKQAYENAQVALSTAKTELEEAGK